MDIASAKQQIKNTVQIYLQKDALGRYRMPLVHQRPVFLLGAPGLGKTAIMQQIADEMGLVERRVYQLHRMGLQKLEPENVH